MSRIEQPVRAGEGTGAHALRGFVVVVIGVPAGPLQPEGGLGRVRRRAGVRLGQQHAHLVIDLLLFRHYNRWGGGAVQAVCLRGQRLRRIRGAPVRTRQVVLAVLILLLPFLLPYLLRRPRWRSTGLTDPPVREQGAAPVYGSRQERENDGYRTRRRRSDEARAADESPYSAEESESGGGCGRDVDVLLSEDEGRAGEPKEDGE